MREDWAPGAGIVARPLARYAAASPRFRLATHCFAAARSHSRLWPCFCRRAADGGELVGDLFSNSSPAFIIRSGSDQFVHDRNGLVVFTRRRVYVLAGTG